jgi:hypothetical protein
VQQSGGVQYVYTASGNTPDTYNNLITYQRQFKPDGTTVLSNDPSSLNDLQKGNMEAESESDWISSNGVVGPYEENLQSTAEFVQGEVYQFQPCDTVDYGQKNCDPRYYANTPSFTYPQNLVLDFATPALQPPTQAPWTLTFGAWPNPVPAAATITGTVSIPNAAQNPGPLQISYVIEPIDPVLTLPSAQVCPGNQYNFNPGNNVVNNGQGGPPPFTVTIPQGQTSVTFPVTVQTYNSNLYNVQVVAWQPSGTLNGNTVPNLESAYCLTVPNTTIGTSSVRRK